jgi:hypothetical protein
VNGDVEFDADGAGASALEPLDDAAPPPLPEAPLVALPEAWPLPPVALAPPELVVAPDPPVALLVPAVPLPVPVTGVWVSGATPWYWAWELDCARLAAGTASANDAARRGRQIRLLIGEL